MYVAVIKKLFLVFAVLHVTLFTFSQVTRVHFLRNCQGEMRMATIHPQASIIWKCVVGMADIHTQKILKFSPSYKLDTAFFEAQTEKIKKLLPPNFFNNYNFSVNWLDNIPDEKAIWFIVVFAEVDKANNYKVYAAVKVVFEGTDARIDQQRRDATVKDLVYIYDKQELNKLAQKLKVSPQAGG